jgi:hypothetical protein
MKRFTTRGIAAMAVVAAMGLSIPTAAIADTTTTTVAPITTTTVAPTTTTTAAPTAWQTWRVAQIAYVTQLKGINKAFRTAKAAARTTFASAINASTTAAQRATAHANFHLALAAAFNARATALTALGSPPVPPTGSARSAYIVKLHAINDAYRTAVASADATFATAIVTATTPAARATVRAALQLAVANAAVARAAALTALGNPPVKDANSGKKSY